MIFALVPYILQLALIIHCIKTNKPFYWIYLIIFIPYVGGVAYLLVELLPALLNSRQLRQTGQSIVRTFNPSVTIKKLEDQLENQDTVSNRTALAQAYIEAQQYDKAVPLLRSCLSGPFADDRATLLLLAQALFADGQTADNTQTADGDGVQRTDTDNTNNQSSAGQSASGTREAAEILQKLQKEQPFSSLSDKLLNVRVRSSLCAQPLTEEFERLWQESKNFEAAFYYIQALAQSGENEKAQNVLEEMHKILKTYKNFSRSIGSEWLRKARTLV
ncbi:hypothetical protein [Treponema lecithinolyticum]|uniref:Cardiolipin synthase N-terminal domain-containing protein n=1 Tax=Treponema lecithinolyticum ATCC 700332 TaxID=1321815 RepID=A0ABN0NX14_TRELE|nr:hypothetical protein [Treponema lecithinolyticum]ERJ91973.1 hypothetical protein HMPREF9193_01631 [Treponema lecithinolyticum ATCC 700332]